jgi:lysozyme family protein
MGNFDEAVTFVLKNEGGFVNSEKDPGGATNFGISLRLLRNLSVETLRKCGIFRCGNMLTVDDVANLTVDQAKLVYRYVFWDAAPFQEIMSQGLCNYIFDMAVQHGINQAVKIAQRALWTFYMEREAEGVIDDGILGELTLTALNSAVAEYSLVLIGERTGFMRLLVAIKPEEKGFLNGWIDRCYRW